MKKLFAPWRIEYIRGKKMEECIFCKLPKENKDEKNLIVYRGKHAFAIMNNYPYNPGHMMIAPYRHVANFEDLKDYEIMEIYEISKLVILAIKNVMEPQGFNIGMNIGHAAGAGIEDHIHLHIVPRWSGDTNFMPVIGDTKVIPQSLKETYKEIKKELVRRGENFSR